VARDLLEPVRELFVHDPQILGHVAKAVVQRSLDDALFESPSERCDAVLGLLAMADIAIVHRDRAPGAPIRRPRRAACAL